MLRELPPGKWYVVGDDIHIINDDGSEEVLSTSWAADRAARKLKAQMEEQAKAEALKQHLAEKRAAEEKAREEAKKEFAAKRKKNG